MQVEATIIRIRQETPTVKSFLFDLGGAAFAFLPGQWVDLYIETPISQIVGGFSITSSPVQRETIEVAVKKISHALPSVHMHERAKVGDTFFIDGGMGDFYYQRDMGSTLVLIAGGIGITPLISILRYVDQAHPDVEATLIYSARTPSELAFFQELEAIALRNPRVRCIFTITRPGSEPWDGRVGRIDLGLLQEYAPGNDALFFICGPTGMMDEVQSALARMGVSSPRTKMERWW